MRINYTSYDVRRDEDVIHTGKCSNVMALAPASIRLHGHPFWYARVLGIYHVNVIYIGEGNANYLPRRLDFLWVRWYVLEDEPDTGRLDRVSFPPLSDDLSFGFLDPDDVLRACHIIPVFREGLACENGPGLSFCDQDHDHKDWKSYVINRWAFSGPMLSVFLLNYCSFVDRDMAMRYHWGHGVGHTYSHHCWDMQKASSSNCQRDAETGITQENLSPTTQGNPSPLESPLTNTGGHDSHEGDDKGGADNDSVGESDDENYDKYDNDDDDYEEEGEEGEEEEGAESDDE